MELLSAPENQKAISELRALNVCVCCQFRALSGLSSIRYSDSSVVEVCGEDTLSASKTETESGTPTCPVCMGILQRVNQITASIVEKLLNSGYTRSPYRLTASIPLSHFLREKVIEEKVKVKFKYELKDVIRTYLKQALKGKTESGWDNVEYSMTGGLVIDIVLDYNETADEKAFCEKLINKGIAMKAVKAKSGKRRRGHDNTISNQQFEAALKRIPTDDLISNFPPPKCVNAFAIRSLNISRRPVYVTGKYVKLSRSMSQTPWILNGMRKGDISVEESISPLLVSLFQSQSSKFSSSGREDVDVRMLGEGRPFVVQLINSKLTDAPDAALRDIEKNLSESDVRANTLKVSDANCMDVRRENEMEKKKNYVCVIWISKRIKNKSDLEVLNKIKDLVVKQLTPLRVLHRRTLMTRDKMIHSAQTEIINDHFFVLRLCASAGTYIKEFVHGDRGRTTPNVGSLLGCEADILQLDVESLELKAEI